MPYSKAGKQTARYGELRRRNILKHKYGITLEDFGKLFDAQRGRCALCNKPFGKIPYIDHDHITGRVRGLLCNKCNAGLGCFNDNSELLERAKRYLSS